VILKFVKMHGCGNDFIVAHAAQEVFAGMASRLMDRRFGIGSDGLMLIYPAKKDQGRSDFTIKMLNPDGSRMGMCGNGIRCVTRYVALHKLIPADQTKITFDVDGREIVCVLEDEGRRVKVDMGIPEFSPSRVPFEGEEEFIGRQIEIGQQIFKATLLSLGNPHCVIFVKDVNLVNLPEIGAMIEYHEMFPERINVEFVQVVDRDNIVIKVWERGAGATLACGTGACASVIAAVRNNLCNRGIQVALPGGVLTVDWSEDGKAYLTGPAEVVYSGELSESFLNI